MELKDKIIRALNQSLEPEYIRLEDDGGITGYVVSRVFENMSSLDRQWRIEEVLQRGRLSKQEIRRVLMIAALTPNEYDAVGPRIRIYGIREIAGGSLEISVSGTLSDAEYARGALRNEKGVQTTDPEPVKGAIGRSMFFRAKGTVANPLSKKRAVRVLNKDPYIEIMSDA